MPQKYKYNMKKLCLTLISFFFVLNCFAQEPVQSQEDATIAETDIIAEEDSTAVEPLIINPEAYHLELRNDTLVVVCDPDLTMPKHIVIRSNDRENIYRKMFNDQTDDLMEDHPAEDIYNKIWTSERVNPYQIPIDSIPDSTIINVSNFVMPVPGYITSKFGPRKYRMHFGTDIKLQIGDSIRCAFDGQVRIVDYEPKGYGHYVVVRHDNGLETVYAHMTRPLCEVNDRVFAGDIIGLGGNTGRSTGPHLHFEIRYLGNAINTELLINYDTKQMKDSTYTITKKQTFYHQKQIQAQKSAKYVTIRQGDSLSVIARRNGTTVSRLCQLNGIKPTSTIRAGRKLRVR